MPIAITVRNVPDDVRNTLASRAAAEGRSLQEYLRDLLIEETSRPTQSEWIAQVRARVEKSGTSVDSAWILEARDADRR